MKKILVIRFSSIGDIVLTSPVVRCLKQQMKDCEVHYLTKKNYRELVDYNPHIDKRFFLDDDLSKVIPLLKKENYDYVVDLHHNIRTFTVKTSLRKKSFSFPKLNYEKWLLVNFKINNLPDTHVVDRYFKPVKKLGIVNDGLGLDFFIPHESEINISSYSLEQGNYIAFAIGGKFATKKLPAEKIISICEKIKMPVVLLGGKEDYQVAEKITHSIVKNAVNLCGKLSLLQSASVIKQSAKVITHDTGLMHIAAALKKEIISVWGSTVPEFGMTPYYGKNKISSFKFEVSNLPCRPCSKLGFDTCPKGHFKCMNLIDENAVADSANSTSG